MGALGENSEVVGGGRPEADRGGRRRHHCSPRSRGSRLSRKASPRRLKPNEAKRMASPANTEVQGESRRKLRPSDSMRPSEGVGGWVPMPRKESEASTRMAVESDRLACTRMTLARLGTR